MIILPLNTDVSVFKGFFCTYDANEKYILNKENGGMEMKVETIIKQDQNFFQMVSRQYGKAFLSPYYRIGLLIFGLPFQLLILIVFLYKKYVKKQNGKINSEAKEALIQIGYDQKLKAKLKKQEENKQAFFNKLLNEKETNKNVERLFSTQFQQAVNEKAQEIYEQSNREKVTFLGQSLAFILNPKYFVLSAVLGFPMYVLLVIHSFPFMKYLFERLLMMLFVILGVTIIVFTLLYFSPSDPARNIIGETATQAQVDNFRAMYGLDDPYIVQLWRTIKGVFTFDLGNAYSGNQAVVSTIMRRFPVTLELSVFALIIALIVALPAGIYSAVKANTMFDHVFMFIALIGLSIPSFWQGLIFILGFSIELGWLPATYNADNFASLIMPAVVLGTLLMASVARMTRSSTLEVVNEDYILTARSKGLSNRRVMLRHAVPNALIPIVTIIGLQFGGVLGGAAVTEQVFNINGIGNYIVERQFIPDIPSVLGGVIYIAIVLSVVNVFIDMLYAFIDPRIRTNLKRY
ncbi:peptide/nickel transport system permease protein [Marinilactibacillus piezotolerans]|uniref:Peptide/nickel transport system permease protein n=1 Tax=Marinilactibacillus piezotolerans TaxID=258723 RepID=A0A1I3VGV5_9LACT|nr:peptide/nickel transport system permease protein [Marinilactibacillus piezotolerans]